MSYFLNFPTVLYKFGNEIDYNAFKNVSAYVDIVDQVKENSSFYIVYELKEGERPDQLSQDLYGSTDYYWTFFALNDHLKKYGWPIDPSKLETFVKKKYPNTTVTTKDYFYDKFVIGERVQGVTSGEVGTIIDFISDLGQIIIKGEVTFTEGEDLQTIDRDSDDMRIVTIENVIPEHLAPHHYETNGIWVDIDPTITLGSEIIPITKLDYYTKLNSERRVIKIFREDAVRSIYSAYNKALKENPSA